MSDEIVKPKTIDETQRLSTMLAKSMLLPPGLRGNDAYVVAVLLTGAELGFAPMQALRAIQIIKGKPSLSADALGALCKRRPDLCEHLTLIESTDKRCVYRTKRKGEAETEMVFSWDDAVRAGLARQDNYLRFPRAMLRARCLSMITRAVYPDLCLGLYDPDETTDEVVPVVSADTSTRTEQVLAKLQAGPPQPAPIEDAQVVAPKVDAAPVAAPPPKPSTPKKADGPALRFGPKKGTPIASIETPQLEQAIANRRARIDKEPLAQWSAEMRAEVDDLEAELHRRMDAALPPPADEPLEEAPF